jgi:DNA primase
MSPVVRGLRRGFPPREALILVAVINHPWLLETHAEELAELEMRHPEADKLRGAIIDVGHTLAAPESGAVRAALVARNCGGALARVEAAITHPSDWPARAGAARQDVSSWWVHVVTLHRKALTLHKELKEVEQALGAQLTEENLAWLRDVQRRLTALEGSEALIEGFGAPSGRPVRSF